MKVQICLRQSWEKLEGSGKGSARGEQCEVLSNLRATIAVIKFRYMGDSSGASRHQNFSGAEAPGFRQGEEVRQEVMKMNPKCSFPTIVINDETCIVGFKKDEILEALGDDQ